MLPKTQSTGLTPISGIVYQNMWGVPVIMYASTLLIPSSTAPFYLTVYLGPSAGSLTQVLQAVVPEGLIKQLTLSH